MTTEPKPESWDPRTEQDKLRALAQITAAMHHGRPAFDQRLDELAGGYPSRGTGEGGRGTGALTPTEAGAERALEGQEDVAARERAEWERDLSRALDKAAALYERYRRIAHPRFGAPAIKDRGCELCSRVPCGDEKCRCSAIDARHFCPVRYHVEVVEKGQGGKSTVHLVGLCSSCYEFQRSDRANRMPTHDEVLDHIEGRRRRWKMGA